MSRASERVVRARADDVAEGAGAAAIDETLDRPAAWFDWLTWPALVGGGLAATWALLPRSSATMVTVLVTTGMVVLLLALERVRPQRPRLARSESLLGEVGHALIGLELGSMLGYGGAVALGEAIAGARASDATSWWPAGWPVVAQVALGLVLVDLIGYLQHRALHRTALLWPLHALHHQPRALDLLKTGRFHLADSASFAFLAYLPLAALAAPPAVVTWVVVATTIGGLLQHANVRMPTPAWLDALVCTPAAHWRHHSRARADDGNFATTCMLIDRAFGTWVPTRGARPPQLGLEHDPLPTGWLASIIAPFRRRLLR